MTDTERNEARRGQIMGAAWLSQWIDEGRGRENKGAAGWIRLIEGREEAVYCWIWVLPYLRTDTDVDEYRGQQAGKTLLHYFAQGRRLRRKPILDGRGEEGGGEVRTAVAFPRAESRGGRLEKKSHWAKTSPPGRKASEAAGPAVSTPCSLASTHRPRGSRDAAVGSANRPGRRGRSGARVARPRCRAQARNALAETHRVAPRGACSGKNCGAGRIRYPLSAIPRRRGTLRSDALPVRGRHAVPGRAPPGGARAPGGPRAFSARRGWRAIAPGGPGAGTRSRPRRR